MPQPDLTPPWDVYALINRETYDLDPRVMERINQQVGGGGGSNAQRHIQSVASATWVINHTFNREPDVAVYVGGQEVDADVAATVTTVTVIFASPQTGVAILS
jgi:hypothetical protein